MQRLSAVGLALVLIGAAVGCGDEVTEFPTGTGAAGAQGGAGPGGQGPGGQGPGGQGPGGQGPGGQGPGGQGPGGGGSGGGLPGCGDGMIGGAEGCDDGNTTAGDGCDDSCNVEPGWVCNGEPSVCTQNAVCGDFVLSPPGEQCDDGNMVSGDGCSDMCLFEAMCGNMVIEPGEECDDGNNNMNDGCYLCLLEAGTTCGDAVDLNDPGNVSVVDDTTIYQGDTTGSPLVDFSTPSCAQGGTMGIPSVLHKYTMQQPGFLQMETVGVNGSALADTVIWAHSDCLDPSIEIACDDDSGPGTLSLAVTGFLPAGTTVYILVAGWGMNDIGPYELHVTELEHQVVPSSGSCMTPTVAYQGAYFGETLMSDPDNMLLSCAQQGGAPDAIYELTLNGPANVFAQVQPIDPLSWNAVIALLDASCSPLGMGELFCDNDFNNDEFLANALAAGTYYIAVDGNAGMDFGQYSLTIDVQEILPQGAPCDPTQQDNICDVGLTCVGPMGNEACNAPLFYDDFSNGLAAFTVTDFGNDMLGWRQCIPGMGCNYGNFTGSASQNEFGLVADVANTDMFGEILSLPQLDATGLATVVLQVDTIFDDEPNCDDQIAIETSTDGNTWTSVFSQAGMDLPAQKLSLDISAQVAGGTFFVRFHYDDSVTMTSCLAQEWRIDDVLVFGF